jgi:hypothetical protein
VVRFPGKKRDFSFFSLRSDRIWGPPSVTWISEDSFPGLKRPELEDQNSPPIAEVNNVWNYT